MSEERAAVMMPNNARLIRRAAVRRILAGRYGRNGVRSLEQLQEELWMGHRIRVSTATLSTDLRLMGAFQAADPQAPSVRWWMLPPFNPGIEDVRSQLDTETIEREVAYKVAGHVYDVVPVGRMIYLMTESRAGPLVAYWLSLLPWPEMLVVQESMDFCTVHCLTAASALSVAERILGYRLESDEDEEQAGQEQHPGPADDGG